MITAVVLSGGRSGDRSRKLALSEAVGDLQFGMLTYATNSNASLQFVLAHPFAT
jgi:hypothetical protein